MGMTVVHTGLNWCEDSSEQCKERNLFSTDTYLAGHIQLTSHKVLAIIVQSLSCVWFFATPWTQHARLPSFAVSQSLLKFMSIESMLLSNHLLLCHPLLLPPSIFPSIRVFSNESALHIRWPKHWSFSFSNSPSNEYSGFMSFRIDWFDLLVVQGTLKSLLQHHSLKASIHDY